MYVEDRTKFWLGGALLVLLALGLSGGWWMFHRTPAIYGAISLSPSSLSYGAAWGYRDPAEAYQRAQSECAHAGAADCAVRMSVAGECAALVISGRSSHVFAVSDAQKDGAGALALAQCQAIGAQDCVVQANFCGNGS